ncbi:unnamed protein product [Paramecium pentaurelia]|uniref:Transmembrane protein n=1 Tax=Paramecium pentaurelia TaxID=43138 RepID=A0A8S1VTN4_9CILI|nr:unnamed protein product [Paramecium pentaurelia]
MNVRFQKMLNYFLELYIKNEEQLVIFPRSLVLFLRIQSSLLSLSYIYRREMNSYVTLLSEFARPQQFLASLDAAQYIILMMCNLYIINLFSINAHTKYIGIFGQLLRSSLLNFFFEYSTGQLKILTHSFLILISFSETLVLSGTLNANTTNFQHTRFSFLDFILAILNYIIMIVYSYYDAYKVIIVLALTMNILKALNLIIFSPLKNLYTKSILLSINLYTLFLGLLKVASIEKSFTSEIVLIPLFLNVTLTYYQRQFKQKIFNSKNTYCKVINVLIYLDNIKDIKTIKIEKPQSAKERIIYSSILILQGKDYEAYLELNSIPQSQLNILEKFKKKVILKQCINKIDCKIQVESNAQHKIALAVSSLMASEESNLLIRNDILSILREKIACQQLLMQNQTYNHYTSYLHFIENALNLQKKLEKQYKDFPCDKTQSILGFYYAEIINDFLQTNQLFSIIALSDEKIKRVGTYQDVFSNKMIYLTSKFTNTLVITRCSNDASSFLQKTNEQLQGKSISCLIPPGIAEHHDKFVFQFLQTGQAKFMRKINQSYLYYSQQNMMQLIEFVFDVNLLNDFSFISFIQPTSNQQMFIIVDQNFKISCLSEGLISELGMKIPIHNYIGINIKKILPDFPLINCGTQFIENAEAHFSKMNDEVLLSTGSTQLLTLITSYNVISSSFQGENIYYIITFDFFKKPNYQSQPSISNLSPTYSPKKDDQDLNFFNLINQESRVKIPYNENCSLKRNTNSLYQIQLKGSQQEAVDQSEQNEVKLFSCLEHTNLISPSRYNENLLAQQHYFSKSKSHKFKLQISGQEQDQYSNEKQQAFQDDRSSQISSLQGARRSKFYKKYEIFTKINESSSFSKNHKLFILMFLLCIIIQLSIQIIQLTEINQNLEGLASDIDLLQIKNFIFQPLETFLVTRWTIVNYNLLRDQKQINLTQYAELIKFPRSNLNLGYDSLDQNLKKAFNRPELQDFLKNTYLEVYVYVKTNQGEIYNISLRNSINILINYQYTFKMAYILDGAAVADSPYVYYQYRNYLPIKEKFSNLNEIVLVDTIQRAANINDQVKVIFIISITILFAFLSLTLLYFIRITRNINKYYVLMQNISNQYIENDLARLKSLSEKISKDQNLLFKYQFSMSEKEKIFENIADRNTTMRRINQKLQAVSMQEIYYYIFILTTILLIGGNATLTYFEGQTYLNKYPATSRFYKAVSDIGTDVPTMYAQRDVLYGRANFPFYTEVDIENILKEIEMAINRTQIFSSEDYNFDNFLVSDSFKEYFSTLQDKDLCDYIPDELQERSESLCPLVMSQNMKRGLKSVLIYIINFIKTDMEINKFKVRTQASFLELEGGFLVSHLIKLINDKFNVDLMNQTKYYISTVNIHNIIVLILLFFIILIILTVLVQKLAYKFHLVKRLTYLLPQRTLIFDDVYERNIRQLLQQH